MIKIGLASTSKQQNNSLKTALTERGFDVLFTHGIETNLAEVAAEYKPQVMLIDLDETDDEAADLFYDIAADFSMPVMINDRETESVSGRKHETWCNKLAEKIKGCLSVDAIATQNTDKSNNSDVIAEINDENVSNNSPESNTKPSAVELNVWVIGSSMGGPSTIQEFFCALEKDLPVAFIVAQHIGKDFIPLLAEQIDNASKLDAVVVEDGLSMSAGTVYILPIDMELKIDESNAMHLTPVTTERKWNPSIDDVMIQVSSRYRDKSGAIVFTGMGNDGSIGVSSICKNGGTVWAQDKDSSQVSSMPDAAREAGVVSYSANPVALAEKLNQMYL